MALYVPPTYGTANDPLQFCGNINCEAAMLEWATGAFAWAQADPRIVGLNPWHWGLQTHIHTMHKHVYMMMSNDFFLITACIECFIYDLDACHIVHPPARHIVDYIPGVTHFELGAVNYSSVVALWTQIGQKINPRAK